MQTYRCNLCNHIVHPTSRVCNGGLEWDALLATNHPEDFVDLSQEKARWKRLLSLKKSFLEHISTTIKDDALKEDIWQEHEEMCSCFQEICPSSRGTVRA